MSEITSPTRMIGAHMPTAGGIANALTGGKAIGCSAVQVFTCSPRQWSHPPLASDAIEKFRTAWQETETAFVCAHDSYLINLAAPDVEILAKSKAAFVAELRRADALGIPWLVTHMGARMASDEETALGVLSQSLREALEETSDCQVGIAIETTAGQGTHLGYTFEHVGSVLGQVNHPKRLGVCLDTCHIFVAGYDIRNAETYRATMQRFDQIVGIDRLKVIHANDAKKPLGSRVDRHDHIGQGEIGLEAFRLLMNDQALIHIPVVVETPDADTMHEVNVKTLWDLAGGR